MRQRLAGRSLSQVAGIVVGIWAVVVLVVWLTPAGPSACARALQLSGDPADLADALAGPCDGVAVRATLWWDLLVVAVYASGVATICLLGASRPHGRLVQRSMRWGAVCAGVAGAADLAENAVLLTVTTGRVGLLWLSQGAALLKWTALGPAIAVAVFVTVRVLVRAAVAAWATDQQPIPASAPDHVGHASAGGAAGAGDARRVWERNYAVPDVPVTPPGGRVGLCLSGGGIRSGTFALGATQVLAERRILDGVAFVAAVSGGGYHAGSHQMLRARGRQQGQPVPLTSAFAPGTPEEDHRRRHGKYIADGAGTWLRAVGVVARNLAVSLALLYAGVLLAARVLGWVYGWLQPWSTPLLERPEVTCPPTGGPFPCTWQWPPFSAGTWLAIAVPLAVAAMLWVWSGWRWPVTHMRARHATAPDDDAGSRTVAARRRELLEALASAGLGVAGAAVLLLVVGPLAARGAQWLATTGLGPGEAPGVGATGGLAALVVTIWNMLARSRSTDTPAAWRSRARRLLDRAGFATRALLSFAVVATIVAAGLLVLGFELERAAADYLADPPQELWRDARLWLPLVLLPLVAAFFDQTRMSLHPFYKRRLATGFAIERSPDGDARELEFTVPTLLSDLAGPTSPDGHRRGEGPRLLLCAAAHSSGPDLAPPGRRVTPFVFSHDWVGGPRLGYLATRDLEQRLRDRAYEGDVTTLAAMALSGAAFASAMGRLSGPFNVLLALTNTRLGAWLPNPRYHALLASDPGGGSAVRERYGRPLPRVRRLPYWLREIVGSYPPDDRFVYVSDGGHYENLGLVELLRRGCDTIYCLDASGDVGAQGLAVAVTVAYEELGVRIDVDGTPLIARTGGATTPDDAGEVLERLEGRLAQAPVVEGEIHYPDVGPAAGRLGRLYVGKAVLTADTPFPVLAYATGAERFPSDTTADQWFDTAQFEAYRALGRWVAGQLPP